MKASQDSRTKLQAERVSGTDDNVRRPCRPFHLCELETEQSFAYSPPSKLLPYARMARYHAGNGIRCACNEPREATPQNVFVLGIVLALMLLACPAALALDPSLDISQYAHTAWKIRDGFSKGTIRHCADPGWLLVARDRIWPLSLRWHPRRPVAAASGSAATRALNTGLLVRGMAPCGSEHWVDLPFGKTASSRPTPINGAIPFTALVQDRDGTIWIRE